MYKERSDYFSDWWNYMDISSVVLNAFLVSNHSYSLVDLKPSAIFGMAAIATLFMWFKLLYWFRLFGTASFYLRLIEETIYDMSTFLVILIAIIFMFANSLYVLNSLRISLDEEQ